MDTNRKIKKNQMLSYSEKIANDYEWFKEQANHLDKQHDSLNRSSTEDSVSDYKRMKVNYDLFNNKLNLSDFSYVCQPYGAEVGELPAKMHNRDIISGKIKVMLGMEMKRPFSYRVVATNPEATTRKEQEEYNRIKEFVTSEIMLPIRQQAEIKYKQQQNPDKPLTPDQIEEIKKQIEEETKAATPEEVKKYMERDHQDPSEVLSSQLLSYLQQKLDLKRKFNDSFKHALISGKEVLYVGVINNQPQVWNVNSIRFSCEKSPDNPFIEDSEWATCEYRMSPSQVVAYFGSELTDKQIEDLYENFENYTVNSVERYSFSYEDFNDIYDESEENTVRVLHCVWKSLRKIGFLTYKDEDGKEQEKVVDESYRMKKDLGDIKVEWEWIPEVYETWKVGTDVYVYTRPIPGQLKDIDTIYETKLPYYGAIHDNLNSESVSLMDRIKVYQYYYNIVMYRLELVMASDKGKKILMNINKIPSTNGFDVKKWMHFLESSPVIFYNDREEGNDGYSDVNTVAKQIDLSLVSDIQKYIEIAEYLRVQAGKSVGITDSVEGQIGPREAVSNTQQSLIQSSHIIEHYFNLHDHVKKNVLEALIECAKVAYSTYPKSNMKLNYMLDDMSKKILTVDTALLEDSTIGLFVSNSTKAQESMEMIKQLTHAAIQNQKAELSDIVSMIRQDGIVEAEEILKVAENKRREYEQQAQQQAMEQQGELAEKDRQFKREEHEMELNKIDKEYDRKEKLETIKSSIMAASFNPDIDKNNNNVNDFIELAKLEQKTETDRAKLDVENKKIEQKEKEMKMKKDLEKAKLKT